ncbi:MAG: alpha-glucan family phosphorylase, partial [Cyclobacteriaceae bacterium]
IWAGKPYPEDHGAIGIFNDIYWKIKDLPNCAILTGYEMQLSGLLKRGSDLWLNTPKMFREASGTSGMTAAMNGSINLSIPDGWIPEFSKHGKNCFIISPAETENSEEQDTIENDTLLTMLENEIAPLYYNNPRGWTAIVKQSMEDILPEFDSNRMAREYYEKMYSNESTPSRKSSNSKQFEVI